MTDTTYNGWTNRATWLVNLWWGDDLRSYHKDEGEVWDEISVQEHIQIIIDHELDAHSPESAFILDMVYQALGDVNWLEIAAAANEE